MQRTLDGRLIEEIGLRKAGMPQLERLNEEEQSSFIERRSMMSSPEGYQTKAGRAVEDRLTLVANELTALRAAGGLSGGQ